MPERRRGRVNLSSSLEGSGYRGELKNNNGSSGEFYGANGSSDLRKR